MNRTCALAVLAGSILSFVLGPLSAADRPLLNIAAASGALDIRQGDKLLATYVYCDQDILRPYFTNLHAPDGLRITRNHPPKTGADSIDHADMHPGVWLAFGDIDGADFWRNRASVEHVEFIESPQSDDDHASFVVRNRYRAGEKIICVETCRHQVVLRRQGCFVLYDSTFRNEGSAFAFGDQEEMGLGVRVADSFRVDGGNGRILAADGSKNERQVRGNRSRWCDYSGLVDRRRAGLVVMMHPQNFRKCWYHARDYGVLIANPFGRQALAGGEPSRVVVEAGETLRLRFGVFAYSVTAAEPLNYDEVYCQYLQLAAKQSE